MASEIRDIGDSLKAFILGNGTSTNLSTIVATVKSVDESQMTFSAIPVSSDAETELDDILIVAEPNAQQGLAIIPAVGSNVIVGITSEKVPFLLLASDIDKVILYADTLVQFNDGSKGGLVISQETASKLNVIENDLNTLKAIFGAWAPSVETALKASLATWISQTITPTIKTDLENQNVTHG